MHFYRYWKAGLFRVEWLIFDYEVIDGIFCHPDDRRDLRQALIKPPVTEDPSYRRDDRNRTKTVQKPKPELPYSTLRETSTDRNW